MNRFVENLLKQAEENPMAAIGIGAMLLTGVSKFIDASGAAVGRKAYARQINHKIKKSV